MVDTKVLLTLREQHFLSQFPWQYIEKLARLATPVQFAKDDFIFRAGDTSRFFYLVVSGSVVLEVANQERAAAIERLGPGDALGWSSLVPDRGRRFQARALETVQALAIEGSRLRQECEGDYEFGYKLLRRLLNVAAERLEAIEAQVLDPHSVAVANRV